MASVQTPLHAIRLAVAATIVGLFWLMMASGANIGMIAVLGMLVTLGLLIWLGSQPAARPLADGALMGLILGLGLGGLMGWGAYQISDFCLFLECEKNIADFWIWFVPILLGQVLLGLAVGSLASGKDKPIPGMEDLPPVRR